MLLLRPAFSDSLLLHCRDFAIKHKIILQPGGCTALGELIPNLCLSSCVPAEV